ncbi:MAG: CHAD domain-containing protein [Rhizobiaceae bacterium]
MTEQGVAYRFKRNDNSAQKAVRRIARDQFERAVAELADAGLPLEEKVHQLRKRCKKLRGLMRLVRPAFAEYGAENAKIRDIAGLLSFLRDADVMIATYDALMEAFAEEIDRPALDIVRRRLIEHRRAAEAAQDLDRALDIARVRLVAAGIRAEKWKVAEDGFAALRGGLEKTYRRARKAMRQAREDPTAEAMHEWRKRVKYHSYHLRLLEPVWPAMLKAQVGAAKRLEELLGDHHDLDVFMQTLAGDPTAFGDVEKVETIRSLGHRRREELENEAFARGSILLAEKPDALAARLETWWNVWHAKDG